MSLLKSSTSKNCNRHNNILTSSDYSSAVHDFNQLPSELISRLYALCQQLINQLNYSKHVVFCIFVLLLSCSLCDALPPYHHANDDLTDRNDFVCNVGNGYECICNRGNGNLEDQIEECTEFFGVQKLPVIKMTLKKINLEDRLHTNETYQQYFRRRVANLISDYCEHQANECIGTTLRMPKVDSNYSSKSTETTTQLILDDDYEPLLTQENVLIVRVNFLPRDRVELYIVITKTTDVVTLNEDSTMNPEKIKYILSAQIAPLSRVLGGVHIEELKIDNIRKINYESNAKLVTIIMIVLLALTVCYVIAAIKCCLETMKRRKQKRSPQKFGPNYGTCTEKLLSYEKPNGKIKRNSITSRESLSSSKKGKKSSGIRTPTIELKTPTFEDDRPSLDARSFTRMFACDPSQLPAEYMYVSPEGDNQSEDVLLQSPPLSKKNSSPITQEGPQIPSMILVSASTPIPPELGPDPVTKIELQLRQPPFKQNKPQEILVTGTSLLSTNREYNPYERPLSRRGSRQSTPEQGEEFAEDREQTPSPLGDENADIFIGDKIENEETVNLSKQSAKLNMSNKPEHWSSDSDSENEVYQRLSEVSEGEEDEKMLNNENQTTKKWKNLPKNNNSSDVESNFSDEEETTKTEEEMLEGHNYKRLQESPVPAVSLPANLLKLDSSP